MAMGDTDRVDRQGGRVTGHEARDPGAIAHDEDLARLLGRVRELELAAEHRGVIECAKVILMERHGLAHREAFELLRGTARSRNRTVFDLAGSVVEAHGLLAAQSLPERTPRSDAG
jgi:hypothetical protein